MYGPFWMQPVKKFETVRLLLVGLPLVLVGCQGPSTSATGSSEQVSGNDPWVLTTTDFSEPTPALLWNGRIGVRISRSGSPILESGTQLPAFSLESYEPNGEERIVPVSDWYTSREAPPPLHRDSSSVYRQELDLRNGVLKTSWINKDKGRQIVVVREACVDPFGSPVYGERWSMKAKDTAQMTPGKDKYIEDEFDQTYYVPANFDDGNPPPDDFDTILNRAELFWKDFWRTDILIEGPVEDQQAIRSFLFYLRTAIQPVNEIAVSPMGLSSRQYFGHVFWDADLWVFPALSLLDPDAAATIPLYRLEKLGAARENYIAWAKAGRPTGKGNLGNAPAKPLAAMYPWESSVSGRETVPGPSKYQHHISGTVSFAMQQAAALGLVERADAESVRKAVAAFYEDRATGQDFKGTMSPDEFHIGDNDLYTNLVANMAVGRDLFKLPRDQQSFLTYDGDAIKSYKQAAAVLAIYPLQFKAAEAEASVMLDRFADKVIKNGPAMTDSVHATIYARIGESDKAYATWKQSWQDFTQHPLMLFSEKRNKDVTYFTTGAGGCLQTVLYGFAGLRIDLGEPRKAAWKTPLRNGYWLSCNPNLPAKWKRMTIKGVKVLGRTYDLEIVGDKVTVT